MTNVVGVNLGVDTVSVTNGSSAFALTGTYSMKTDGSLVHAAIKIGGVSYIIATVISGTTGTLTINYAGATNATATVAIPSGQGTGIYEVLIQVSPAACQVLNTYTGVIAANGAWASTNGQTVDSTCNGMYIHDGFIFRDADYMQISGASTGVNCGSTNVYWQTGTNHEVPCTANATHGGNACGGHSAVGYHNDAGNNNPYYLAYDPANAASVTALPTFGQVFVGNCDNHTSWRNGNLGDTNPVVSGTASSNYTTSGTTSSWTGPDFSEILIAQQNGTIIRPGHNFVLGPGAQPGCTGGVGPFDNINTNFQNAYSIGAVSQDGRFWLGTSSFLVATRNRFQREYPRRSLRFNDAIKEKFT